MKQLLLTVVFSLSAFATQATSILTTEQRLPVDAVSTGLRQTGADSFKGPLSIQNTNTGIVISADNNACTIDGLCTQMAPVLLDATLVYLGEDLNAYYFTVVPDVTNLFTNDLELSNPINLEINKHRSQAVVTTAISTYDANSYVWVVKHDGSITCDSLSGISLYDMYQELAKEQIYVHSMAKAVSGEIMPMVCGIKSPNLNAYLVNTEAIRFLGSMGYVLFRSNYPNGQILN